MFLANKLNKGAGSPAAPVDDKFNYVTMLLHGDGTNGAQNNTFLDSSTNNFTITRNGNTTQGSFSPYGSNWANYFDGTGDYLNTANSSAFAFGTGDFTVECWINTGSNNVGLAEVDGGSTGYWMWHINAGTMSWQNTRGGSNLFLITGAGAVCDNAWHHLAIVRNSSVTKAYWDGVEKASASDTTNYSGTGGNLNVGYESAAGKILNGYMSNFRIVKGTAVYTAAFTPPTTPLTAITNTSLVTCQSNRFVDNSASPKTITVNGNTSVQRFNPFGASTAYSTSVIGGSGYFDGSGDYLTSSCGNVGTGDFTIEGWFYFRTTPSTMGLFQASSTSGGFAPNQSANLAVATGSSSTWQIYAKNTYTTSSSTSVPVNAWGHMALVRSGTTTVLYINGVAVITLTSDSTNYSTSYIGLGGIYDNSSYLLNGYLSNFRVVVGTAVYTAAFTPPTAQLTAISGTALLTNFTNGAIIDNAMMNDLETVGNAQISTSVKKYGTGSLYFDGSGDYLSGPTMPTTALGSGAYTVEFWLYKDSTGTGERGIFQTQTASLYGLSIFADGTTIYIDERTNTFSGTDPRISGTISQDTWIHVAVCRQTGTSGTLRAFVNGTQIGSSVTSGLRNLTSTGPIIVGNTAPASNPFKGYIDDLRITNGYARYTATFTPPTAAFSDIGPY